MKPEKNDKPAPTVTPTAPLITATVRPGGSYTVGDPVTGVRKTYTAGQSVEVTAQEYQRVRHTLVTREDAEQERAAATSSPVTDEKRAMFRSFRTNLIKQGEATRQAKIVQRRRELEEMGLRVS